MAAKSGRFGSIDGLRGYLALMVFLHHSAVWYFYLKTGQWKAPPSNLYVHFGHSSVLLFFMITGLLFFNKLLGDRNGGVRWDRLYVSRILCLGPLYGFVVLMLFVIVLVLSRGELTQTPLSLLSGIFRWITFTIIGASDLNGIKDTFIIVAGVTWSLRYEWLFYFSLPVLSLLIGNVPPFRYLCLSAVALAGFAALSPPWHTIYPYLMAFLGGMLAAVLTRADLPRRYLVSLPASIFVVTCFAAAVAFHANAFTWQPILLLTAAFCVIATGNDIFGLLSHRFSRALGELAYSIYLVHGLLLFTVFTFVIGRNESAALPAHLFWSVIIGLTPVLLFVCYLTFQFIERPALRQTEAFTDWIRQRAKSLGMTRT